MNLDAFDAAMKSHGIAVLRNAVPMSLVDWMRDDLNMALSMCKNIRQQQGVDEGMEGAIHHLPAIGESFLSFLEHNPAALCISRFFGGKAVILQSMGGNFNNASNYASAVHRDIRSYFPFRLMLNTLVALDDLTAENGATWLLPGSGPEKPSDEEFDKRAVQITAPVGSILLWDSRVWHRAGVNRSGQPRRIVTPIFTLPFYKPGFDYCRALGEKKVRGLPEGMQQVLGWNSRIPAKLQEWYQPKEKRFYQGDQG